MTAPGCGGHPGLTEELRALALSSLDRLTSVLDRARAEPVTAATASSCAVCPVCAVLAVLRGERPELAVRLAEQAAGLVGVLRTALEDGAATSSAPIPDVEPGPTSRSVQRIPIKRVEPSDERTPHGYRRRLDPPQRRHRWP